MRAPDGARRGPDPLERPRPWATVRRRPGSADVVIAFPGWATRAGPVEVPSPLLALPCHLIVYANTRPEWAERGLPGLVDAVPAIADDLRALAADLGATRVRTTGLSYGGYCALLFGALLDAERVLAFGAETAIGLPGARSLRLLRDGPIDASPYADLRALLRERPPRDARLVCGEDDLVDLLSGRRLAGLPGVAVHSVPESGHNVHRRLGQIGALKPTLDALLAERFDPAVLGPPGSLLHDAGTLDLWIRGAAALAERRHREAAADLRAFLHRRPRTPTARRQLAQALRALGWPRLGGGEAGDAPPADG